MSILAIQWVWWLRGAGGLLMCVTSLFLILLVMLQRGRGGGLTGAFGGAGGQSAFGTKTGDVFTKFTVYTAVVWILLCIGLIFISRSSSSNLQFDAASATTGAGVSETETTDSGNAIPGELMGGIGTSEPDATQPATPESKTSETPPANESTPENSETP